MRIGISVDSHQGQRIWESGLGQQVIFLARLFRRLPFLQSVLLIDVGDLHAMPPQVDLAGDQLRLVSHRDATDRVDVTSAMSWRRHEPL
ncbi:DUF2827 family protein [Burkholderia ubonensis]|uniref:DUF2827 family protein n=1 Tax=Burkholderia ubonensis TaxID=101571 RepID=UPI0009B40D96|nr:DUF2827 family protein [Burkholderia ubonensis]